ncbi:uncharacterized protein B0J16DRAFT_387679 [Fusarium flagelliforme]|uniref:Caspase domain-containing protein n=1 Tax=Fusarium flagelliforme TaxID=2675880 RepID=A0A395MG61_9HYPO|nr:uncharacterized protein B0J16DRAFT_387679 [Fusarium flagelliforme]KAH7179850.1 hypothetical protein B0J16DRAFT_387679 [Fusarium flagelliforme]RFN46253.1 hypothetical protein FIE12Z_9488 [Fusarium flagelliforme]
MTDSSTHPANAFSRADPIGLEDLNRVIQDALDFGHHSSARKEPYREVRVLCFHFDTEGGTYCDKVRDVFSQGFGFQVATCTLPSTLPCTIYAQRDMIRELLDVFDGMDSDCLVIIYYVGKGEVRSYFGPQLWMQGHYQEKEGGKPEVNFNTIRNMCIDHQPAKVLMLLDTCHAPGGGIGRNKEIIAACSGEHGILTGQFTDYLVDELTNAASKGHILTTPQLYSRLAKRQMMANNMELWSMPVFIAGLPAAQTPISIKPMNPRDWSPCPSPTDHSEIRVVLSVHLKTPNLQAPSAVREWIQLRRSAANRIRVDNVYPSNSTTVIVIMTITLECWYTWRDHPAFAFLGLEVSHYNEAMLRDMDLRPVEREET